MSRVPFWGPDFAMLEAEDPEIAGILLSELDRARSGLQLIASENFTSPAVLAALGSTLSNKYAEGYPGRRYYGGCAEVDKVEDLAVERAKTLFGALHTMAPPRGPRSTLWVVKETTSACGTGLGMALPATSPMKCAASTQNTAPTSSATRRKNSKSMRRGMAEPPARMTFGLCSLARRSTSS